MFLLPGVRTLQTMLALSTEWLSSPVPRGGQRLNIQFRRLESARSRSTTEASRILSRAVAHTMRRSTNLLCEAKHNTCSRSSVHTRAHRSRKTPLNRRPWFSLRLMLRLSNRHEKGTWCSWLSRSLSIHWENLREGSGSIPDVSIFFLANDLYQQSHVFVAVTLQYFCSFD